jgi:hypothetical protein
VLSEPRSVNIAKCMGTLVRLTCHSGPRSRQAKMKSETLTDQKTSSSRFPRFGDLETVLQNGIRRDQIREWPRVRLGRK